MPKGIGYGKNVKTAKGGMKLKGKKKGGKRKGHHPQGWTRNIPGKELPRLQQAYAEHGVIAAQDGRSRQEGKPS